MGDYHVHLHPHEPRPDSPPPGVYPKEHVDAYVETALSRGAGEVGFTEHLHRFTPFGRAGFELPDRCGERVNRVGGIVGVVIGEAE